MADLAYPDEQTHDAVLWLIPGIAEISFERATGTVTGVRPQGVPETPPTEYAAMDIDELRAVAQEYRLALRDGTLLAELIGENRERANPPS